MQKRFETADSPLTFSKFTLVPSTFAVPSMQLTNRPHLPADKQAALNAARIAANCRDHGLHSKLRFRCPIPNCHKTFLRRYNLKVHSRKHTNEKPYACTFSGCAKRFKWRSSMAHHYKSHVRHFQQQLQIPAVPQKRPALKQSEITVNSPISFPHLPQQQLQHHGGVLCQLDSAYSKNNRTAPTSLHDRGTIGSLHLSLSSTKTFASCPFRSISKRTSEKCTRRPIPCEEQFRTPISLTSNPLQTPISRSLSAIPTPDFSFLPRVPVWPDEPVKAVSPMVDSDESWALVSQSRVNHVNNAQEFFHDSDNSFHGNNHRLKNFRTDQLDLSPNDVCDITRHSFSSVELSSMIPCSEQNLTRSNCILNLECMPTSPMSSCVPPHTSHNSHETICASASPLRFLLPDDDPVLSCISNLAPSNQEQWPLVPEIANATSVLEASTHSPHTSYSLEGDDAFLKTFVPHTEQPMSQFSPAFFHIFEPPNVFNDSTNPEAMPQLNGLLL